MSFTDFFLKQAKNVVTRTATSLATTHAKSALAKFLAESPEQLQERVNKTIGYPTHHYRLGKYKELQFDCSPVFVHEWLTKAPENKGKILKDEESGKMFVNGKEMDNPARMKLINRFLEVTKVKATATVSHFDNAWKLFTPTEVTSGKFLEEFAGGSGTATIDNWLKNCFGEGLESDNEYATNLFKKWIVGTARRALVPGTSLDGAFTLSGPTNTGKTRFFRLLLPEPFDQRTAEVYCDIKDPRKFTETLLGHTIVCFDELAALEHSKVIETFKQLLTKQGIDVRLAWRRDPQRYNLRQGFGANSNKEKFIQDPTLSRRLWVVKLNGKKQLDFDFLRANSKQLWKEAFALAQTDFTTFLMPKEVERLEQENKQFLL